MKQLQQLLLNEKVQLLLFVILAAIIGGYLQNN
jgi:hypothetical protein